MFIYSLVLLYILIYFCELVEVGLPQVQLYKSNSEHDIHIFFVCSGETSIYWSNLKGDLRLYHIG